MNNNKLKNYSTQPDAEVWEKIRKTLRRQEFHRQAVGGVIGAAIAVAAIVVVTVWPDGGSVVTSEPQKTLTAQVADSTTQVSPTDGRLVDEPVSEQTHRSVAVQTSSSTVQAELVEVEQQTPAVALPTDLVSANPQQGVAVPKSVPVTDARPSVCSEPDPVAETLPAAELAEAEKTEAVGNPITKAVKNAGGANEDTILWVPNAFAPNSDNPDITTFRARLNKSDASVVNYRIGIFNRQGHQVFHSTDINQAWDGTYKGRALPQGGYVYVIRYVDKDGLTHQRKGTVALIR